MYRCRLLILLLVFVHTIQYGSAQVFTPKQVPNVQLADSTQYISDPTDLLSAGDKAIINDSIASIRHRWGVQMAVVILPEIEDDDPEGFAHELFQLWGIGQKDEDNGLLLLYIYKQPGRAIRFEVGYGLEGILTDALTSQISRRRMIPLLLEGKQGEGILEGVKGVREALDGSYIGSKSPEIPAELSFLFTLLKWSIYLSLGLSVLAILRMIYVFPKMTYLTQYVATKDGVDPKLGCLYILFPLVFIFCVPFYRARKKIAQKHLNDCPQCKNKGTVSVNVAHSESPDLTPLQQTETKIGSKIYLSAHCSTCDYHEVKGTEKRTSPYHICPKCSGKTLLQGPPHRISSRTDMIEWKCMHCLYKKVGYSNRSGGSWGGGSFGGGSSWGGGGSWGGGSSGGGGSTVRF